VSAATVDTQFAETTLYGDAADTYRPFQGWEISSVTSASTKYGKAELFSTYIETSGPDWVAGGFIQAMTENQANTSLTIGTTGLAFEFFGGGLSDTIGSLSSTPTTTQTGLFPLAWLSAIHEGLQTAWQDDYDPYLEFAAGVIDTDTGSGATATAVLSGTTVGSITVTNPGSGYTTAPTVTISGGGGSGATATAVLSGTTVGSITVTNPGSGYTTAPTVIIAGAGSLWEALSGEVFQKVREGNSFSWADGYSMVQYEEGFQSVTVGSLDSLEVLDMENFQSQRQKIAEGLRGGKWPKINVDNVSDLTVTNQKYASSRFEVEIPSGFTTTNGPDEYNPELNFSSRRFGSKWSAVTGNQVVFGTGSGDFNLGPVLNFSYYSKDAQKWSIDITDDMVEKLFSDWEHEFDVNTDASTSAPEYASDLEVTAYPTPDNIDATQLFDEVPTDEWWTTRNKLVKTGLNESYEICASGDYLYSWEKGNKRDVLIEDEKGQKRSANYDDGEGNYTYTQRDLTESESHIDGVLHETRNITSLDTKIKTGFNLSTDITWLMGLSTDEVGFTMGGPLKPYDGKDLTKSWKDQAYFDTNTWKGQGATGSLNLQLASWEINAVGSDTSMTMTNPTNMRITSEFDGALSETEFEVTGSSWDVTIALLGETLVNPTGILGTTLVKGQEGKLSFADVKTFLSSCRSNAGAEAAAEGADAKQTALKTGGGESAQVSGGAWTFFGFEIFT
jgi:hypothetical protein